MLLYTVYHYQCTLAGFSWVNIIKLGTYWPMAAAVLQPVDAWHIEVAFVQQVSMCVCVCACVCVCVCVSLCVCL